MRRRLLLVAAGLAGAAPAAAQDSIGEMLGGLLGADPAAVIDTLAPMLANAIQTSRDEARAGGVQPIPEPMKQRLGRLFPRDFLDRVGWRVGDGREFLPTYAFRLNHSPAIALIDTIVFVSAEAADDEVLWAHELTHIQQYEAWGLDEFARRYVVDFQAVEAEATWMEQRYAALGSAPSRQLGQLRWTAPESQPGQ